MTTNNVEEHSIVIVDDIPNNLRLLADILQKRGYKVRPAANGSRALDAIRKEPPSIILLVISIGVARHCITVITANELLFA